MIRRLRETETLRRLIRLHPVVGVIGARQVGKTTLVRSLAKSFKGRVTFFDLENPEDAARIAEPMLALRGLQGLVVIDEVQRQPDLFSTLRVLVDRPHETTRFLILGSASPELLRQGSETLAGRIVYHELGGFSLDEVGTSQYERLWFRGGFPKSYTASGQRESFEWRRGFIRTFLEKDLPQLGIGIRSTALHRFWTMLAHYHGQVWNASEFARSFGVADTTVRHYLDQLGAALVVRQLHPWHENLAKRQVKSPKVYITDSGILHALLNLRNFQDLEGHPKVGASWEGFVLGQATRRLGVDADECFFWATHGGAELDLLVVRGRVRLGFEIKRTTSPRMTSSIRQSLSDLKLQHLDVIHAGDKTFPLAEKVRAVAFASLLKDLKPL